MRLQTVPGDDWEPIEARPTEEEAWALAGDFLAAAKRRGVAARVTAEERCTGVDGRGQKHYTWCAFYRFG